MQLCGCHDLPKFGFRLSTATLFTVIALNAQHSALNMNSVAEWTVLRDNKVWVLALELWKKLKSAWHSLHLARRGHAEIIWKVTGSRNFRVYNVVWIRMCNIHSKHQQKAIFRAYCSNRRLRISPWLILTIQSFSWKRCSCSALPPGSRRFTSKPWVLEMITGYM